MQKLNSGGTAVATDADITSILGSIKGNASHIVTILTAEEEEDLR